MHSASRQGNNGLDSLPASTLASNRSGFAMMNNMNTDNTSNNLINAAVLTVGETTSEKKHIDE